LKVNGTIRYKRCLYKARALKRLLCKSKKREVKQNPRKPTPKIERRSKRDMYKVSGLRVYGANGTRLP